MGKINIGDMPVDEFKDAGYKMVDWISDYLKNVEEYPVLPNVEPGDIKKQIPQTPPEKGERMEEIFPDIDKIIMPGMTHWNHPNFMAYFNSTGSAPGILAEFLTAALAINGMLWKSAPASTELEQVTLGWLRQMMGLPENFWGIIYDTASVSSMHAIAAARENCTEYNVREKGLSGRGELPRLRLYLSEYAHNSIDKGAITIGIGLEGVRKIKTDDEFKMIPEELERAIEEDKKNGWRPFCVVATVGTTSITSIDPVSEIADICEKENLWLHVDAAHAGIAAIVPEMRYILNGIERADSMVVNPHKWMFTPMDLSCLYTRKPDVLRRAFSLEAEYLKTSVDEIATNYMDYGIQLGRRFRSLKLWFIIRYFGVEGIRNRIKDHLRLGKLFCEWVDKSDEFERMAPVPLSTICFRGKPDNITDEVALNAFNEKLMEEINSTGKLFLTHTKLHGKFVIRLVISGLRTEERHVEKAWKLINEKFESLIK